MSNLNTITRTPLAVVCAGVLAAGALAHEHTQPPLGQAGGSQGSSGVAIGTVHLPTMTTTGILVAVGQDVVNDRVYMIDAVMTSALPASIDPRDGSVFGAIEGQILEVTHGALSDAQDHFSGYVEGMWNMEPNLEGSYEALVYTRDASGDMEVSGLIMGGFRVAQLGEAVPGPAPAPGFGDARGERAKVALRDRKGLFDDASTGKKSSRPAGLIIQRQQQRPPFVDAAPDKALRPGYSVAEQTAKRRGPVYGEADTSQKSRRAMGLIIQRQQQRPPFVDAAPDKALRPGYSVAEQTAKRRGPVYGEADTSQKSRRAMGLIIQRQQQRPPFVDAAPDKALRPGYSVAEQTAKRRGPVYSEADTSQKSRRTLGLIIQQQPQRPPFADAAPDAGLEDAASQKRRPRSLVVDEGIQLGGTTKLAFKLAN